MGQEKRFGKRVAEPSSVQIVHELKLMALRQALDAATARETGAREAAGTQAIGEAGVRPRDEAAALLPFSP